MRRFLSRLRLPSWRPRTITRVTFGIVSVSVAIALVTDATFNVLRDDVDVARQVRKRVSENVAIQMSVLARKNDAEAIQRTVTDILSREPDLVSIGLRRTEGEVLFASAAHEASWTDLGGGNSTLTHVQVPLRVQGNPWGRVEIVFRGVAPETLLAWLKQPVTIMVLALSILGTIAYTLFLRRTLQSLDPSKSIPDSVGTALDTLAEGLMILDTHGRILMVNDAFRGLHPAAREKLIGRRASGEGWLCDSLAAPDTDHPWSVATRTQTRVTDVALEIGSEEGRRQIRLTASPVRDAKGTVRGCFVSFNDVTALHDANTGLRGALHELRSSQALVEARNRELEASKLEIELKNRELERLAHYDPLTGVMNRRAFMAKAGPLFEAARRDGTHVAVVMTDIDKFKSVNDTYGHAVGDEVIQQVARVLGMGLRTADLLARYGGEEFCILLPGLDPQQALEVADRLRQRVEQQAGPGVRSQANMRVTASFGVSEVAFGATTLPQMIEEADQALYASKQAGRNFATLFSEVPLFRHDFEAADLVRVREATQADDLGSALAPFGDPLQEVHGETTRSAA